MTGHTPTLPYLVRVVREMSDDDLARFEIVVDLDDIVGEPYEDVLDLLSQRATGSILLQDIRYGAVRVREDGALILWVEGDTSDCDE
jgi:hypothetical protein